MDSVVTDYKSICVICGRPAEAEHHLIFGTAGREICEQDGLKIPICNDCHNMGEKLRRIHGNSMAERLSKMLGQAVWERQYIINQYVTDKDSEGDLATACSAEARRRFRDRYGRSYL